jgi:hypothetical protein
VAQGIQPRVCFFLYGSKTVYRVVDQIPSCKGKAMKIHVEILDDEGLVQAEHTADASTPSRWTAPSARRFLSKMPQNASDVVNNGTYELFGITFQPIVRVDRPNGWITPVPGPNARPTYPQNFPPSLTPQSMWGTSSPTKQQNLNQPAGFAPTSRG